MTLKQYIEGLSKFLIENPNTSDMQVVSSQDDEGNCFHPIVYSPSKGYFDCGEFISDGEEINAVCVN